MNTCVASFIYDRVYFGSHILKTTLSRPQTQRVSLPSAALASPRRHWRHMTHSCCESPHLENMACFFLES